MDRYRYAKDNRASQRVFVSPREKEYLKNGESRYNRHGDYHGDRSLSYSTIHDTRPMYYNNRTEETYTNSRRSIDWERDLERERERVTRNKRPYYRKDGESTDSSRSFDTERENEKHEQNSESFGIAHTQKRGRYEVERHVTDWLYSNGRSHEQKGQKPVYSSGQDHKQQEDCSESNQTPYREKGSRRSPDYADVRSGTEPVGNNVGESDKIKGSNVGILGKRKKSSKPTEMSDLKKATKNRDGSIERSKMNTAVQSSSASLKQLKNEGQLDQISNSSKKVSNVSDQKTSTKHSRSLPKPECDVGPSAETNISVEVSCKNSKDNMKGKQGNCTKLNKKTRISFVEASSDTNKLDADSNSNSKELEPSPGASTSKAEGQKQPCTENKQQCTNFEHVQSDNAVEPDSIKSDVEVNNLNDNNETHSAEKGTLNAEKPPNYEAEHNGETENSGSAFIRNNPCEKLPYVIITNKHTGGDLLLQSHVKDIIMAILKKLDNCLKDEDNCNNQKPPFFTSYSLRKGVLTYSCEDEYSCKWLVENFNEVKINDRILLRVLACDNFSKIVLKVKNVTHDPKQMLHKLKQIVPGLKVEMWQLVTRHSKQEFGFRIDPESLKIISENKLIRLETELFEASFVSKQD